MNILSLFDGMSCGQIALNRIGKKYKNYYASEIDKYAIGVTQNNYPNTIQLGDVKNVNSKDLPKIDLLMGGSPCQGFSYAGNKLNFDDPRSKLFFEFVRLLKELRPKYFLLENVKMVKESQNIISEYLGVEPIELNSNLVSAQNRKRLYWTNIKNITLLKDRNIFLKDILICPLAANYYSREHINIILDNEVKQDKIKEITKHEKYIIRKKEITLSKEKVLSVQTPHFKNKSQGGSRFGLGEKMNTLNARDRHGVFIYGKLRELTPLECERLQTVPDNYTEGVSNAQRYKMLGNGWTVDVIAHILKNIYD